MGGYHGAALADYLLIARLPSGRLRQFRLTGGTLTLGRAEVNHIVLDDPGVSRRHAKVEVSDIGCHVIDLESSNGLVRDGRRVPEAMLGPGNTLLIGQTQVTLVMVDDGAAETPTIIGAPAALQLEVFEQAPEIFVHQTDVPRLVITRDGVSDEMRLDGQEVRVGRADDNDLVIDDASVSRYHLVFAPTVRGYIVRDLGSTNGTRVRGQRIDEHLLVAGDTIALGGTLIQYQAPSGDLEVPTSTGQRRRPVVVVPGLMGSELWAGSTRIWPNVGHFLRHPGDYVLPDRTPLEARALVDDVVIIPGLVSLDQYGRLRTYLRDELGYQVGVDLFEYPYDWRKDLRDAGRGLAAFLRELPGRDPVTIVAHSMGSLVTRYAVDVLGARERVERVVMLGGPHHGSLKSMQTLLSGQGLAPIRFLAPRVRRAIVTYPSIYALLPEAQVIRATDGTLLDPGREPAWHEPGAEDLVRAGVAFRRELPAAASVPVISILGYGVKTPARMVVERNAEGRWVRSRFEEEVAGDGVVLESSAWLRGSDIQPVRQFHGALYTDPDVKARLRFELLDRPRE